MIDYRVSLKSSESSYGIYPSDAEVYFGDICKWFSTREQAQEYVNTFEVWEQDFLAIKEFPRVLDMPF